jgi:hypothetical protein
MRDICYVPYCREKNKCIRVDHNRPCCVTMDTDWSIRMAKASMEDRRVRLAVDNDMTNGEWLTRWIGKTILVSDVGNVGKLSEIEVCFKNKNAIRIKWILGNVEVPEWVDPLGFCARYTFFEEIIE